jgi:dTDP-4-amino-4,6-dideoxygalactose transaminase
MNSNGNIPFVDLVAPHVELSDELVAVCKRVIETAGFIGGPEVVNLEKEFAQFCDAQHCVVVNSGTDALRFALAAVGVQPGDIVVTVPNTFIATTEAVSQVGATPAFVDVDETTYNMDPKALKHFMETQCVRNDATGKYVHKQSGKPVTAVMPVHLYGQMADMDALMEVTEKYGLFLIEDACQAHGAEYFSKKQNRWLKAGSVGHAAGFSFYPGKNLGACGEGGAATTNDPSVAKMISMLRDHGQAKKYYHDIEGYNGRLDSMQAGMLRIKLRHLAKWNELRRRNASQYGELMQSMSGKIGMPSEPEYSKGVFHLYVIRTAQRDQMRAHLEANGIGTGIHYPIPLHLQKAYRNLGYKEGDFPVTEKAALEILSLPMYPQLELEQQRKVVAAVEAFVATQLSPAAEEMGVSAD